MANQVEIDQLNVRMHQFGGKVYRDALASGLTWDEIICALGTTSKALASGAVKAGNGSPHDVFERAHKVFTMGFNRQVVFVREDIQH